MSIKNKYIGILLIATAMLLSACSSDNPEAQTFTTVNEPVGKEVQLMSYASPFTDQELSHRAAPAGFTAYKPDKTTNMGVYMLLSENPETDWDSPKLERITYNPNTNKWNAYFEVTADKNYTVYGYMPKTGEMGSTLAKSTADAATLTINNIKPVTTDDICIITGVKGTDDGLKEGLFSWYTPVGAKTYKISLLMDHLYAAAQFRLKIDAEYAALRTIKLKTMTLRTVKGSVNATIALTHNTTGTSPISSITYTLSDGSSTADIYNSNEGTALPTTTATPLSVNAYFAPELSSNLTLVSTYDVYDRKGNLIRQDCTATNKLPNLEAIRGQRVQLNLTVNPTYLYVLSDPDLDNPTITIGN
jgi:hypothetical protein